MSRLTFVSHPAAKEGYRFIHEGPMSECPSCKYFPVCHENLRPRGIYQVANLRDKTINCPANGQMLRLVEVTEAPLKLNVPLKVAIEGANFTFTRQLCSEMTCPQYDGCVPTAIQDGSQCRLNAVEETFTCPKYSTRLAKVEVQPLQA
ncbi:MAG: UPF0179 family protein [Candidatus Bathyarchaeia archaeon]